MNIVRIIIPVSVTDTSQFERAIAFLRVQGVDAAIDFQTEEFTPEGVLLIVVPLEAAEENLSVISKNSTASEILRNVQVHFPVAEPGNGGDSNLDAFGFPIGGNIFGLELPRFVWLGLGLYTSFKTIDSDQRLGQVAFGSAAAISWTQYLKG